MVDFSKSNLLNSLPKQFFASLAARVEAEKAKGHDVINLGQGNPDQPTPPHIVAKLQEAVKNPMNHKYSPFSGYPYLKEAAAAYYQREYGVELDAESEVAILFGGKAGLVQLPQCLLNPGDTVLVPDPGYPDYLSGIMLAQVKTAIMPLLEEKQYLPDYQALPLETLNLAKLMYLNYPNNPTGAAATSNFFERTVKLAKKHTICVVHDFAYGAIGFDGNKPLSFLQTPGAKEIGIEIYTLSKTYNMAGWRVGFAVGNKSVIEAINLLQDHLYVSLFPAIQEAAAAALLDSQTCVEELIGRYQDRRDVLIDGLQSLGWNVTAPEGSFFAWLKVPKPYTSEQFSDLLLRKAHVAVAAGNGFGEFGEGYVRVGLLCSEDRLREAVKRIEALDLFTD
ncbi:pyridoxal phosphate-dependent aminotransferase [Peribacillus psychrosaccharolyticus]|uniref:Pyridoxal phosphate-dependent aminotransferase n=1 Tax=Peribacillus psychrosaccharolyticus TaxID=1407 RepID=A0A974S0A5_PERPY|nr:pyridoxal phosphate-dependent aminotransferase [Peribacillus psychrosaccharolyticus]MEC2056579.1 pyridoxal phosphate-dependent aminotransferase [Peribacillus psychrosaccharolyticus]MED3745711.1 pyridoxal phosphate-dependent aminotransferase [Peribacillus psychrosaccharolyticus]QQT00281.1 pyridoxal phosphate-dependent aminotransferase [Peribacillus psychrosaccharolyticus]